MPRQLVASGLNGKQVRYVFNDNAMPALPPQR
ncbi:hypothetical protein ABIC90_001690 [Variovorax boronicumulans]